MEGEVARTGWGLSRSREKVSQRVFSLLIWINFVSRPVVNDLGGSESEQWIVI